MAVKYRQFIFVVLSIFVLLLPVFSVRASCDGVCPVVIVPGILASFDKKLMYQDIEDNKWKFVPFGNVYKTLINELKDNGYVEGENLFIAYYDWRKPVSENWSKYLKSKINEAKRVSGKEQVDLVAHSMGGLLSRAYIQNDSYGHDVNKLVMMGTPNYGASEAYVVWEGGQYPQSWNYVYKSFLNNIQWSLKRTRDKKDILPPLSFREFFPSIRDILPTQPFVKMGNNMVAIDSMSEKNNFLIELNKNINTVKSNVVTQDDGVITFSGLTGNTMETILLGGVCTAEDNAIKRWRDGHPNPDPPTANSAQGDETVLLSSSKLPGLAPENNSELPGISHTLIPDDASSSIAWFLNPAVQGRYEKSSRYAGFVDFFNRMASIFTVYAQEEDEEPPTLDPDRYIAPDSMLSFTVSPNVNFEITDPDGKVLSRTENQLGEDNANFDDDPEDSEDIILITIRNPKVGKYTLKITGNTAGAYYIDSTFVNNNGVFDDSNEGEIKKGEEKTFEAVVSETSGVDLPANETDEGSGDTTTTNTDNKTENKTSNSSGANTSKNKSGTVLGATTVRVKLSAVILGVRQRLEREIASPPPNGRMARKDYVLLVGPVNEMLSRARAYETALAGKKIKVAEKLLQEIKGDYRDFANKVEKLIANGKLNKQTVNVLTALVQRLGNAGLR